MRFLNQRAKVKVTIMFRGRETTHPERGRDLLMRLAEDVKEIGQVEQQPLLDGRNMTMVLGPTKNAGVTERQMPKQKTHSAAKKRFKVTGTGKLLRRQAMKSHQPREEVGEAEARLPARLSRSRRRTTAKSSRSCSGRGRAMPRVKRSVHARKKRRKVLEQAKGYWGLKHSSYRHAKEQVEHSLVYAYRDRKNRSGRSAGSGSCGSTRRRGRTGSRTTSSSPGCRKAEIELDRKVLADLAVSDPEAFGKIAEQAKAALESCRA